MVLVMIAAQASAEDALPLGFLEFLGDMVEVQDVDETELLDPLDFEKLAEPGLDALERAAEPVFPEVDQVREMPR